MHTQIIIVIFLFFLFCNKYQRKSENNIDIYYKLALKEIKENENIRQDVINIIESNKEFKGRKVLNSVRVSPVIVPLSIGLLEGPLLKSDSLRGVFTEQKIDSLAVYKSYDFKILNRLTKLSDSGSSRFIIFFSTIKGAYLQGEIFYLNDNKKNINLKHDKPNDYYYDISRFEKSVHFLVYFNKNGEVRSVVSDIVHR